MKNVNQRNAPGAMSAMAFEVRPVKPSVDGGFDGVCSGDMQSSLAYSFHSRKLTVDAAPLPTRHRGGRGGARPGRGVEPAASVFVARGPAPDPAPTVPWY